METSYKNIGFFVILILGFVVWGFFRTYFGLFPGFNGITTVQHFHGAMMLSWFALLIVQPFLIRFHHYDWHRKIGRLSYIIAPLVTISIFLAAKGQFQKMAPILTKEQNIGGMALNIPDVFAFAALYLLAMVNKKNTAYHMRYMIATSFLMLGPGTGRAFIMYGGMPFPLAIEYSNVLSEIVTATFLLYDIVKGKPYKPYLITLIILLAMHLIWECQLSFWWQAFAGKIAALFF